MKAASAIFLSLICLFSMINGQNTPDLNNDSRKAAQELWEKVIAAKGGRENLYAVKNLVVSKKSFSPSEDEEFQNSKSEELYILSGKWWSWTDDRPGFTLKILQYDFDQEIGYELTEKGDVRVYKPFRPDFSQKNNAEEVRQARLRSDRFDYIKQKFFEDISRLLMETKWFQPEIKGTRSERVTGNKLDVIEVSFGRIKLEYFIDPKTYLPNKIRRSVWFDRKKEFTVFEEFFLEDYIEVAGIKFPQVVKLSKNEETKTTYQVNVKYDENLFNKEPTFKYGSEGWKPRQ